MIFLNQKPLVVYAKGEDGYKTFSIRIRTDTVEKIDNIVKQTGRTRNELIGIFLEYAVEWCKVETENV